MHTVTVPSTEGQRRWRRWALGERRGGKVDDGLEVGQRFPPGGIFGVAKAVEQLFRAGVVQGGSSSSTSRTHKSVDIMS